MKEDEGIVGVYEVIEKREKWSGFGLYSQG